MNLTKRETACEHSIDGFFAGILRKNLKLNPVSEGDESKHICRIAKRPAANVARTHSKKRGQ